MADDVPVDSGPEKVIETPQKSEDDSKAEPDTQAQTSSENQTQSEPKPQTSDEGASAAAAPPKKKITIHVKTPKEKESFEVDGDINIKDVSHYFFISFVFICILFF